MSAVAASLQTLRMRSSASWLCTSPAGSMDHPFGSESTKGSAQEWLALPGGSGRPSAAIAYAGRLMVRGTSCAGSTANSPALKYHIQNTAASAELVMHERWRSIHHTRTKSQWILTRSTRGTKDIFPPGVKVCSFSGQGVSVPSRTVALKVFFCGRNSWLRNRGEGSPLQPKLSLCRNGACRKNLHCCSCSTIFPGAAAVNGHPAQARGSR